MNNKGVIAKNHHYNMFFFGQNHIAGSTLYLFTLSKVNNYRILLLDSGDFININIDSISNTKMVKNSKRKTQKKVQNNSLICFENVANI